MTSPVYERPAMSSSSSNYNSGNSTNVATHSNLRQPYVRPTSLRSEYYDDVPKTWIGGKGGNNMEIESLIGGTSSLSLPEYVSSIWATLRHHINLLNHLFVAVATKWIASMGQNKTRCYILLLFSIVAECYSTALSKQAKEVGSTRIFFYSCLVNFFCLVGFNISLAHIEVSVAYAIWSAMGTCLVTVVGILIFNETYDLMKIVCLGLITAGVVGLNLREDGEHH